MWARDSLQNLFSGLGTAKDKAANDRFGFTPLSDQQIDAMCDGDWVARKLVDLPVKDMMRVWRKWDATPAAVDKFEAAEKRHGVRRKIATAMMLARRYGGCAIIIGDGATDPTKPLNANALKRGGLKYLTVVKKQHITCGPPDRNVESPTYGEPVFYTLNAGELSTGVQLHPSRVIRFLGAERFDLTSETLGWGYSALQAPYEAVHHAALASGAIASLVHEAKVDIISVKNLGAALSTDAGTAALTKRFSIANMMKSINNMLLLDADEVHDRKQVSFTGLPDLMHRFLSVAAAAADIPACRFLAQSASAGLNSSGDTDIRNYYDNLSGERERVIVPVLDRLDDLLWRDATGKPAATTACYQFTPLWQPTEKERAETMKIVADACGALVLGSFVDERALSVGLVNYLVETGLFPGLEHALDESATLAADPATENDPTGKAKAPAKTAAGGSIPKRRGGFARVAATAGARDWHGSTAAAF